MNPALWWLIAGAVLVVAEAATTRLVLIMLGLGALAASASATIVDEFWLQTIVFLVVSTGMLIVARPVLKRHFADVELKPSGAAAIPGKAAIALTEVTYAGGQVRIDGEIWSARTASDTYQLAVGDIATVQEIAGATAIVVPLA